MFEKSWVDFPSFSIPWVFRSLCFADADLFYHPLQAGSSTLTATELREKLLREKVKALRKSSISANGQVADSA